MKTSGIVFDPTTFMGDFFTKGFYVFSAEKLLRQIPVDAFRVVKEQHPDKCFHAEGHEFHPPKQARYIQALLSLLKETYINRLDENEMLFDFFAEECNDHVLKFHSDAQYAHPKQNATINCFFDEMNPEVGGRFDMAPYHKDTIGKSDEAVGMNSVYPQRFDVIIFNQNRNFLHKAVAATVPRRVISYACTFKNINPLMPNWTPG